MQRRLWKKSDTPPPQAPPFSPLLFWEKTAAQLCPCFRAQPSVGVSSLAPGVFAARFRALIMVRRQPCASAHACAETARRSYAINRSQKWDGHTQGSEEGSWAAEAPYTQTVATAAIFSQQDSRYSGFCFLT